MKNKFALLKSLNPVWLVKEIPTIFRLCLYSITGKYPFQFEGFLYFVFFIIYFILPIDLMPDMLPILGFGDELILFLFLVSRFKKMVDKFKQSEMANKKIIDAEIIQEEKGDL